MSIESPHDVLFGSILSFSTPFVKVIQGECRTSEKILQLNLYFKILEEDISTPTCDKKWQQNSFVYNLLQANSHSFADIKVNYRHILRTSVIHAKLGKKRRYSNCDHESRIIVSVEIILLQQQFTSAVTQKLIITKQTISQVCFFNKKFTNGFFNTV